MTEHILHVRVVKGVNGKTPGLSGSMMDMEQNQSLPLTSYEAGKIATVLTGETRLKGERVVYLHQDNTPERTASGSLVDLKTDQPCPLSPEDAKKIAKVVRQIEEIEVSSYSESPGLNSMIKRQLRNGIEPNVMGKPLWRNLI